MNRKNAVQIMDVIPVDLLKENIPREFENYPIYELVAPGVLKVNCGSKRRKSDILVYDVSSATPSFKDNYSEKICELHISQIIGLPTPKVRCANKIISVLPLDGVYSTLSKEELCLLGTEFVTVTAVAEGLLVKPLISCKLKPDNIYIRINLDELPIAVREKIESETSELYEVGDSIFLDSISLSSEKNFE